MSNRRTRPITDAELHDPANLGPVQTRAPGVSYMHPRAARTIGSLPF